MTSTSEKNQRKVLCRQTEERLRQREEAKCILPKAMLAELFDYLDSALTEGCDHNLRLTKNFLEIHSLPQEVVVPWLAEYGGYCDCEVLANVEERWPAR